MAKRTAQNGRIFRTPCCDWLTRNGATAGVARPVLLAGRLTMAAVGTTLNNIGEVYRVRGVRSSILAPRVDFRCFVSLQAMGKHAEALRNYEESLRIKKAALGPDHHAWQSSTGQPTRPAAALRKTSHQD